MFSFDLIIYIQILLSNFYTTAILLAVQSITVVLRPFTSYAFQILISLGNHEASEALRDMIKIDGAGSWPPKASHRDTWPTVLRPYHDIFLELAPLLPVDRIITNDSVNQVRRVEYRTRMQKLLQERLDLSAIKSLLFAVEKTNNLSLLPANVCNGLFACIAHLRHAFRYVSYSKIHFYIQSPHDNLQMGYCANCEGCARGKVYRLPCRAGHPLGVPPPQIRNHIPRRQRYVQHVLQS